MAVRRIPLEDFFRKPERIELQLSPDGSRLAFLAPWERRLNVHVQDLESGEVTRASAARERDILAYLWVDDRRLVYGLDEAGDENFRLYAVDRDGGNPVDLTPFEEVQCSIVDELEDVKGELLFAMNHRKKEIFDVYHLDTNSGEMRMVVENPGDHDSWVADHQGRVRVAITTDGVNKSILYRETEEADWREVARYDFKEYAQPLLFAADDRLLYAASNVGRDKSAVVRYDPDTGRETDLLFEHPEVDVHELIWSKRRKAVLGFSYEVERPEHYLVDEERRAIQDFLDGELPGAVNEIVSANREETRFVVNSMSDRHYGAYYLLDGPNRKLNKIHDSKPWLAREEMAPISYEARDGRTIRGYLTLPVGRDPTNLPLVVNPHGGPYQRDQWLFNPEIQFLANRGYAVLQMNFRGSSGFGREFIESSFGQWGLAMQDDITDGVHWAIGQGIADPKRVAIYGGSYGGYATLSGLTKTPELYACGISYVGPSSIFTWIEAFPPYWKPYLEMVYEMVGHPERDEKRLRETSPLFNVDRIRVPLLVAQGANDPRARKQESDQIVEALRARGGEVEYIVKDNEGHGFLNEENRFEFYGAIEAFLERHL
jgi:dipeptidyl aminopeptidase/acylaminoacyl peptidase